MKLESFTNWVSDRLFGNARDRLPLLHLHVSCIYIIWHPASKNLVYCSVISYCTVPDIFWCTITLLKYLQRNLWSNRTGAIRQEGRAVQCRSNFLGHCLDRFSFSLGNVIRRGEVRGERARQGEKSKLPLLCTTTNCRRMGIYTEKCPLWIWKRYIPLLIDLLISNNFSSMTFFFFFFFCNAYFTKYRSSKYTSIRQY